MIIRHDLRLVFLHVPKCAGKEIRDVLKTDAQANTCTDRFNFAYSDVLHRHVDLAHLTMDELTHDPDFQYLQDYTVIAAVRNPYERLLSAANEYYRQFSPDDESVVNSCGITSSMMVGYVKQIPWRHAQRDPRFVHSLPISWFTHLGTKPMVDYLLRCETLRTDFLRVASLLQLPNSIIAAASSRLRDGSKASHQSADQPAQELNDEFTLMANLLYKEDFTTFGYPIKPATINPDSCLVSTMALLQPQQSHSHSLDLINTAKRVRWHWGPSSQQTAAPLLAPTRQA